MFIYIHLPFCLSHCIYCDFYVELKASPERRQAYLKALISEINFYLEQQENPPVQAIYLGGGTPGLFSAEEIKIILHTISTHAPFSPTIEMTMEANPETLASHPFAYLEAGVNRFSVGVQSMQPNELKRLSRIHSVQQVNSFIQALHHVGCSNISIDLMYGIPEQTLDTWSDTLSQITQFGIQHVSMYGLKVEPNTRLDKLVAQGRMQIPEDELTVEMYYRGLDTLSEAGFLPYEISNLAQPGKASRHNLNYWNNGEFWGFGVSAHGYTHSTRTENPRDLAAYLEHPTQHSATHFCTETETLENALIFGLRKTEGVYIPHLEKQYQFNFQSRYHAALTPFYETGWLDPTDHWLRLTRLGIPMSNSILEVFIGKA